MTLFSRPTGEPIVRRVTWGEVLLLLIIVAAAIGSRVADLSRPFFADDYLFLEQTRGPNLLKVLVSPDPLGNYFRPVGRQLWFWVLGHLGHEQAWVFRLASLCLFGSALLLLHVILRPRAGTTGATAALVFLAAHYSADVPLLWVSGAQDLIALVCALATLALFRTRLLGLAVMTFAIGILAKETVLLTPFIAAALGLSRGMRKSEVARNMLPFGLVLVAWASAGVVTSRTVSAHGVTVVTAVEGLVAALAHLPQVVVGLELNQRGARFTDVFSWPSIGLGVAAMALVGFARLIDTRREPHLVESAHDGTSSLAMVGATWALAGTIPIALVATIWSAYFYLFAMAGVAVILAACTRRMSWMASAGLVGLLVIGSANARRVDEFSPSAGAWTSQSHVNRHYLSRGMETVQSLMASLRSSRPTLPPRSTLFFASVPKSVGWQTADGPLVRWAYQDTSLRSYFITEFTRTRAARGPYFFFVSESGRLVDHTGDPQLLPSFAYSCLLADRPNQALDALDLTLERRADPSLHYWRAWARWASGDTLGAQADLRVAGMDPARRPQRTGTPALGSPVWGAGAALAKLRAERDAAALAPHTHARLAAATLDSASTLQEGTIEAYAFKCLSPVNPDAWRKWSAAQLSASLYKPALTSLNQYFNLAGPQGVADLEAKRVLTSLLRVTSGDLARDELHRAPAE